MPPTVQMDRDSHWKYLREKLKKIRKAELWAHRPPKGRDDVGEEEDGYCETRLLPLWQVVGILT